MALSGTNNNSIWTPRIGKSTRVPRQGPARHTARRQACLGVPRARETEVEVYLNVSDPVADNAGSTTALSATQFSTINQNQPDIAVGATHTVVVWEQSSGGWEVQLSIAPNDALPSELVDVAVPSVRILVGFQSPSRCGHCWKHCARHLAKQRGRHSQISSGYDRWAWH